MSYSFLDNLLQSGKTVQKGQRWKPSNGEHMDHICKGPAKLFWASWNFLLLWPDTGRILQGGSESILRGLHHTSVR